MLANTVSKFHSAGTVAFCVFSVYLKFHYAYSTNTHNRIIFEDLRHSRIPKCEQIQSVLFSVHVQFHSAYSQNN
jgi:hypothetical protein